MLKLGVAGIGGYAGYVCDGVLDVMASGGDVKLVATCDPRPNDQARRRDNLLSRGIPVLADLDELLLTDIDAVWLPVPIDLHRAFTEKALAAGKAVLVEKPAAGSIDEIDAMIAARDQSGRPVAVGFQNLFDPNTWEMKRQILEGTIGEIRAASVIGCWPRTEAYYTRATWAGRASRDGTWVLDSPVNNALAHFANLALFLLGDTAAASAIPASVEAELFRTYSIEMFDTAAVRVTLKSGVPLTLAMTHACRDTIEPIVTLEGTNGSIRFLHDGCRFEVLDRRGRVLQTLTSPVEAWPNTVRGFTNLVRGRMDAQVASLENARSHTLLVNAISEAATIVTVPDELVHLVAKPNGEIQRAIEGIESALNTCARKGRLMSELRNAPLPTKTGHFDIGNYHHFPGPRPERRLPATLTLQRHAN